MNFSPLMPLGRRIPSFFRHFLWIRFHRSIPIAAMLTAIAGAAALTTHDAAAETIRCDNRHAPQTVHGWIQKAANSHQRHGFESDGPYRATAVSAANRAVAQWVVGGDIDHNFDLLVDVLAEGSRHGLLGGDTGSNHREDKVNRLRGQLREIVATSSEKRPELVCESAHTIGIAIKEIFLELFSTLMQIERSVVPRGQRFTRSYLSKRLGEALRDPVTYRATLFPSHPEYLGLVAALARYRSIVAMGGWDQLTLEERLVLEGWLTIPRCGDGPEVTQAIRAFQDAHGLTMSGHLDASTISALSVPARDRLRHVMVALERWRQSPTRIEATYLRVNIPAYSIEHWRNGELVSHRRAVVGSVNTPTDRLDRRITHIQLNPPWYVPWGVQQNDLRIRALTDPEFYERNGFKKLRGGGLVQPPRPDNWLGQVIFRWTGPGLIYIHDTPFRERFDQPTRCYSHGCVHAESAEELARTLIVEDGALTPGEFDTKLASGTTQRVRLKHPMPAYIEYVTVKVDEQGRIGFLPDVYGLDAQEMAHVEAPVVARVPAPADRRL